MIVFSGNGCSLKQGVAFVVAVPCAAVIGGLGNECYGVALELMNTTDYPVVTDEDKEKNNDNR